MKSNLTVPAVLLLAALSWAAAAPAAAQEEDAGQDDFTQPDHSTTIQGEGIDPIPLNRANSDRMAVALAREYASEGRFAEAVQILSALQIRRPNDQEVATLLARTELAWSRKLMAEGAFTEAFAVLLVAELRRPHDRDIQILLAQTEVAQGNPEDAIIRLERLAAKHPDWPRPRVELALAHGAAGNFRKAKSILIAELGKDPPPHVRANIETAVRQLEDRQRFVGRFNAGVAPDSNITGGTYNDTVEFLGLPFTLNDDAKEKSGVRGDISTGGTLRTGWHNNERQELSLDLRHSEPLGAEGTPISDVRLAAAVRLRRPKGNMRTGLALQPFYRNNELQRIERSLFLEAGRHVGGPVALVGNVTLSGGNFAGDATRDFHQWETGLGPSFAISRRTRFQIIGSFGVRNAEDGVFSFIRRGVSANLVTAPANGWRLNVAGALTRDVYDDVSAFGAQKDLVAAANLEVVKTGWVFWGFSPRLGLGYSEVRSTIDLFDKRSYSVILGAALPY